MATVSPPRPPVDAVSRGAVAPTPPGVPTLSIRGYGQFLARHRFLVGLLVVAGLLVGLALAAAQPIQYTAVSRVAVTPQETAPTDETEGRPRLVSLDSDAQLLTSTRVLAAAIADLEGEAPPGGVDTLRTVLVVSAVPNSRVLIIRYSDPSPQRAAATCSAIVNAFLRERAAAAAQRAQILRSSIEGQIANLSDRLAVLGATGADTTVGTSATELEEDDLAQQVASLQQQLAALPTMAQDPGIVISAARQRDAGQRPMAAPTVASGILIGLITGLVIARAADIGREQRRRRRLHATAGRVMAR